MSVTKAILAGLFSVGLLGVAAYLYLFRALTIDNSALGVLHHKYRWGKPFSLSADTNRDGKIDFKAVCWGSDRFDPPWHEQFEDRDFDGCFELRVEHDREVITKVEIDKDCDGVYDGTLTDKEARDFYARLPPPVNARASQSATP